MWVCTSTRSLKLQQLNGFLFFTHCAKSTLYLQGRFTHLRTKVTHTDLQKVRLFGLSTIKSNWLKLWDNTAAITRIKRQTSFLNLCCQLLRNKTVSQTESYENRKMSRQMLKRDVSSTLQGTAGRSHTRGCLMARIWQRVSLFLTVVSQWGSGTITPCQRSTSTLYMNKAVGMMYALSPDQHTMSSLNL